MQCLDRLLDAGSEQMYADRVEPKVFLANERTFLNWLSMSVTLGSIASVRPLAMHRARMYQCGRACWSAGAAGAAEPHTRVMGLALCSPILWFGAMKMPSPRAGAHGLREEGCGGCGGGHSCERLVAGHRHRLLLVCR